MKLDSGLKNTGRKKTGFSNPQSAIASSNSTATAASPAQRNQNRNRNVTIEAKIDVGFGNTLYLRGEGHGLSWNQGVPLVCVDNTTWKWSGEASNKVKFKLLLNDSVWSKGEDLVAAPGEKVEVAPDF